MCVDAEMSSGSSSTGSSSDEQVPTQKVHRGPTKLPSLVRARSQGNRVRVHVNDYGEPIGDTARVFANYLGVQARSVSILYENWHKVPRTLKDQMWNDIIVSLAHSLLIFNFCQYIL